jgi:hypothetical protein
LIQVSNDDGDTWTSLCGQYTRPGVSSHGTNDPLYDGWQDQWVVEEIDLSDYNGQVINLRLVFVSDAFVTLDGFYIDDLLIENNTLVTVGSEDLLAQEAFSVLPSLNDGTFDVKMDLDFVGKHGVLEVLDMGGKLLERRENITARETLHLRSVDTGVYIVKVWGKNGQWLSKKINVFK